MAGLEEAPRRDVLVLAGLGTVVAFAVTGLLALFGRMDGPTLLSFGGAAVESLLFALAAGALGAVAGSLATSR